MDPDQTAPLGASRSSLIRVHTVCLYAKIGLKSLQEYTADDMNRQHFPDTYFLGILKANSDAAPNYKHLYGPHRGLLPHL